MSVGGFLDPIENPGAYGSVLDAVRQPNPNNATLVVAVLDSGAVATGTTVKVQLLSDTQNPPNTVQDQDQVSQVGATSVEDFLKLMAIVPAQSYYRIHAPSGAPTIVNVYEYTL